jgi:hypothetical protein
MEVFFEKNVINKVKMVIFGGPEGSNGVPGGGTPPPEGI